MSRFILLVLISSLMGFVSTAYATTAEGLCDSHNKKLDRFCEDLNRGHFFDDDMINVCLWGGQVAGMGSQHNLDGHICIERFKNIVFPKDTFAKCTKPSTSDERMDCLEERNAKPISTLSESELAELGASRRETKGTALSVIRILQKRAENAGKKTAQCEAQITAFKQSMSSLNGAVNDGDAKKTREHLEVLEKAIRGNVPKGN
jgi:hypothetical protein